MAIKDLKVSLNLDSSQFTASVKDASGNVKKFEGDIKAVTASLKASGIALSQGRSDTLAYIAAMEKAGQTDSQRKQAKDQFLISLKRELETMGLSTSQLRAYQAQQLGLTKKEQELLVLLEKKAAAISKEAAETAKYQSVLARVVAEDEARITAGKLLVQQLEEEVLVMRAGADALLMEKAALGGVTEQIGLLLAERANLIAQQETEVEAERLLAEEAAKLAAAQAAEAEALKAREVAGAALLAQLDDEILVMTQGNEALLLRKAAEAGVEAETMKRLASIREINQAERLEAEQQRLLLEAAAEERKAQEDRVRAQDAVRASIQRQIISMREQVIATKGGASAVAEYRLSMAGLKDEIPGLIAEFRAVEEEMARVSSSAHVGSRAIYELNVLMHEISSGRLRQAISSLSILLANIGITPQAVLGLTLTIGLLYGLSKPIEEAAKKMEELKHQSQELGVGVSTLQLLGEASDLLGIKTDKIVGGIGRLDQAFARARAGSKTAQDAFKSLGISLNENLTNEQLINKVVEGYGKLEDGPRKVAISTALFGRSGRELIPILDELSDHMSELKTRSEEYGLQNTKAVDIGAELAEKWREASLASKGLGLTLIELLGPGLIKFVENMGKGAEALNNFLRDGAALRSTLALVKESVLALAAAIATLVAVNWATTAAAWVQGLIAVNVAFGGATTIVGSLTAAFRALTVAMLANPWIAVAAAVGVGVFAYQSAKANVDQLRHSHEDLNRTTQSTFSALVSASDFLKKYGGDTKSITESILKLSGATKDGKSATDEATKAAWARAEAEKASEVAILRRAAAEAQSAIQADKKALRGNPLLLGIDGIDYQLRKLELEERRGQLNDDKRARLQELRTLKATTDQDIVAQQQLSDASNKAADTVQNLKPTIPKSETRRTGTTEGDPFAADKGGKAASTELTNLEAEYAGLKARLADVGSEYAKMAVIVEGHIERGGKERAAWEAASKAILDYAKKIDAAKEALKGKAAYDNLVQELDRQKEAYRQAKADQDRLIAGTDANTAANERYRAGLLKNIETAKLYTSSSFFDAKSNLSLDTLGSQLGDTQNEFLKTQEANKGLQDLINKYNEAKTTGVEMAAAVAFGTDKAGLAMAKLNGQLSQYIALQNTPAARQKAIEVAKDTVDQTRSNEAAAAIQKMNEESKRLVAGLGVNKQDTAKQLADDEIESYRRALSYFKGTEEEKKKLTTDFVNFVDLKYRTLQQETPFGKLAKEWGDAMGNMEQAAAGWANSWATDLAAGKLNMKNFAASIIADIAQIVTKALLAKYVIGPLLEAFGITAPTVAMNYGNAVNTGDIGSSYTSAASMSASLDSASAGLTLPTFHTGGIVGTDVPSARTVDPSMFDFAMRYHTGGVAGLMPGEIPAILQKNEGVFTEAQMKQMGAATKTSNSGGPPVQINLNNQSGVPLDADHNGGRFDGEKYILDVVVSHLSRPGTLRNAVRHNQ